MRKNVLLFFLFCLGTLFAQKISVRGSIKDGDKPMIGISVKSIQGKDSVLTNKKGYFLFKSIDAKDTLLVYIKGQAVIIPLEENDIVNINVKGDSIFLDKKKSETIPLSFGGTLLTRTQLEKTGETNLLKAISLRVAGVEYINGNLLIRGKQTILMGSDPLYVINGVQTSDASYLQVLDVESVEVLKGPETAAFGVKGANGVIVIKLR